MQITGLLLFCLLRILAGIADSACMFDIRARRNNGSDIDDIDTGIFYYSLVVLAPPDAALKTCQLGRKSDSWSRVCRKQNATAKIYLGKYFFDLQNLFSLLCCSHNRPLCNASHTAKTTQTAVSPPETFVSSECTPGRPRTRRNRITRVSVPGSGTFPTWEPQCTFFEVTPESRDKT
jgi:hypothetical protein